MKLRRSNVELVCITYVYSYPDVTFWFEVSKLVGDLMVRGPHGPR